jgi:hypothetical protein
MRAFLVPV